MPSDGLGVSVGRGPGRIILTVRRVSPWTLALDHLHQLPTGTVTAVATGRRSPGELHPSSIDHRTTTYGSSLPEFPVLGGRAELDYYVVLDEINPD